MQKDFTVHINNKTNIYKKFLKIGLLVTFR